MNTIIVSPNRAQIEKAILRIFELAASLSVDRGMEIWKGHESDCKTDEEVMEKAVALIEELLKNNATVSSAQFNADVDAVTTL